MLNYTGQIITDHYMVTLPLTERVTVQDKIKILWFM